MPKKKTDKAADKGAEQAPLTEWQKRNLEFQERKRERQEAKEREEELRRQERLAQLKAQSQSGPMEEKVVAQLDGGKVLPIKLKPEQEQATKAKPQPGKQKQATRETSSFKSGVSKSYRRAGFVLVPTLMVLLMSLFLVSPYSKMKHFVVSGAQKTNEAEVLAATGIKDSDYITSLIGRMKAYERAIVANDPWVKSAKMTYDFPNTFKVVVEEYPVVAYNLTANGYRPVLANGVQVDDYADSQFPEGALPLSFEKASDRVSFIKQLMTLEGPLREAIVGVEFAGSEATKDLLLLTMAEGHTVRVPLSEISLKLPYYQSIKEDLLYPTIIDMEVGIYTTSPELETLASETKASREQERREAEALASSSTSETETSSSSRSQRRSGSSSNP